MDYKIPTNCHTEVWPIDSNTTAWSSISASKQLVWKWCLLSLKNFLFCVTLRKKKPTKSKTFKTRPNKKTPRFHLDSTCIKCYPPSYRRSPLHAVTRRFCRGSNAHPGFKTKPVPKYFNCPEKWTFQQLHSPQEDQGFHCPDLAPARARLQAGQGSPHTAQSPSPASRLTSKPKADDLLEKSSHNCTI